MPRSNKHTPASGSPQRSKLHDNPLPAHSIDYCLSQVRIALTHGSRPEAISAINRAFDDENRREPIEYGSPLAVLNLSTRVSESLESRGILTVGALSSCYQRTVTAMVGDAGASEAVAALDKYGMGLRGQNGDGDTDARNQT